MTTPRKGKKKTSRFDDFVELVTSRLGRIAGLVLAIGGLAGVVVTQLPAVQELIAKFRHRGGSCLQAEELIVPTTVKYSEWDNMKIKLRGSNECPTPRGVYIALKSPQRGRGLFLKVPPYATVAACGGLGSWQEPLCWDKWKPLDAGPWQVEFLPPPLGHLSDLRPVEVIAVAWEVYDYDAPTSSAIRAAVTTIEVHGDSSNL